MLYKHTRPSWFLEHTWYLVVHDPFSMIQDTYHIYIYIYIYIYMPYMAYMVVPYVLHSRVNPGQPGVINRHPG